MGKKSSCRGHAVSALCHPALVLTLCLCVVAGAFAGCLTGDPRWLVAAGVAAALLAVRALCVIHLDARRLRLDDPVFGPLNLMEMEREYWVTDERVVFEPTGEEVRIFIFTGLPGPTDEHRACFVDLRDAYPELRDDIGRSLFHEFDGSWLPDLGPKDGGPITGPSDIWRAVCLERICIDGSAGALKVVLGYEVNGPLFDIPPEFEFTVTTRGHLVQDVSLQ